jgi:CHAD domain-containing protein
MTFYLRRKETAGAGLIRIVLEQLGAAAHALAGLGATQSGDAVHRARRSLRKGRAALLFLRPDGKCADWTRCAGDLRDAGRLLSPVRDAQVALTALLRLTRIHKLPAGDVAPLRRAVSEAARAARRKAAPGVRQALVLIRKAESFLCAQAGDRFDDGALSGRLAEFYRRARKARRAHTDAPDAGRLHEWRKRTRDLYFAMLIVRVRSGKQAGKDTGHLRRLAKTMGRRLDLEIILREAARCEGGLPSSLARAVTREQRRFDRKIEAYAVRLFKSPARKWNPLR